MRERLSPNDVTRKYDVGSSVSAMSGPARHQQRAANPGPLPTPTRIGQGADVSVVMTELEYPTLECTEDDPLNDHVHHLVRQCETRRRLDEDEREARGIPDLGERVEVELVISDVWCFTCSQWVGLADIRKTGQPRDATGAHYHRGPPPAVRELVRDADGGLSQLLRRAKRRHPEVSTRAEALEFIRRRAAAVAHGHGEVVPGGF